MDNNPGTPEDLAAEEEALRLATRADRKILAVVGSTALDGPRSRSLILDAIRRHRPTRIISGGAKGIDTLGAQIGRELGLEVDERKPDIEQWDSKASPDGTRELKGYKARNLEIAALCDVLIRIAWDPREQTAVTKRRPTFGSGWTRDRALSRNVPCEEYILNLAQDADVNSPVPGAVWNMKRPYLP